MELSGDRRDGTGRPLRDLVAPTPGATAAPLAAVGGAVVVAPVGPWPTVRAFLAERFPHVGEATWRERLAGGRVTDELGRPIGPDQAYAAGRRIRYHREVADEPLVPFAEHIVHQDEHIVVVDKPPFLPVMPGGDRALETLVGRLYRRLGAPELVALHRLDRHTAGLVVFSVDARSRAAYQELFRTHAVERTYACVAPPAPGRFPLVRTSRLAPGEPFFRVREVDGPPNSESAIAVVARDGDRWTYALRPVTGRKHQLRVHMAAIGAPILHDPYYPALRPRGADDLARPLALLACDLAFVDPLTSAPRRFTSTRSVAAT